jgi:hypothetical protein
VPPWSIKPDGTIQNGTKCLDAEYGKSDNWTQLIVYSCISGAANQKWALR